MKKKEMVICENTLIENGAELSKYQFNESLFKKDTYAEYYLQIKKGSVKICVSNYGKELLYGLPVEGHCIGESYLFTTKKYPFEAIAISDCEIIKLPKDKLHQLIKINPNLLSNIYAYTAERTHYNSLMLSHLGIKSCVERMIILLDYIKDFHKLGDSSSPFVIPYTRQQLASLTGLRLETIIRTVKKMEDLELLSIINGKIYY